jgi:hypothetical protein
MWVIIIILGIIAFLVMEHPVAFWLIFVPLGLLLLLFTIVLFKSRRAGLAALFLIMMVLFVMMVALILVV